MGTDLQTITLSTPGKDMIYLSCVTYSILTAEQEQS